MLATTNWNRLPDIFRHSRVFSSGLDDKYEYQSTYLHLFFSASKSINTFIYYLSIYLSITVSKIINSSTLKMDPNYPVILFFSFLSNSQYLRTSWLTYKTSQTFEFHPEMRPRILEVMRAYNWWGGRRELSYRMAVNYIVSMLYVQPQDPSLSEIIRETWENKVQVQYPPILLLVD